MAYSPTKNAVSKQLPFGMSNLPLDNKLMYDDPVHFTKRAFISAAEILGYFPLNSPFRNGSFEILLNTGGTLLNGVITGGVESIWWFSGGTADVNLIQKYYTTLQVDNLIGNIPDPNLQNVTTGAGNNVTNNVLQLAGFNNFDPSVDSLVGFGGIGESGFINIIGGQGTGAIGFKPTEARFVFQTSPASVDQYIFLLRPEDATTSGANINRRLSFEPAENGNEGVTLDQLNAAIPNLAPYELLANKSTSTSLGTSNTLYPTQNAVKVYVDTALTGKANLNGGNIFNGTQTINGNVLSTNLSTGLVDSNRVDIFDILVFTAAGHGGFSGTLDTSTLTANRNWDLPNNSGIIALQGDLAAYQLLSQKGNANGYAPLDGSNKIPLAFLPAGFQTYKGTYDASTNTPTLVNGTGTAGDTYRVTVAGSQDFGAGSIAFIVGDDVIYNGTIWQRNPSVGGITLGTTNGLSLVGQELSLALSSTSTVGALSSADWNTFNSKQPAGSYELTTNKGLAGGYASLDSSIKIPVSQIHEPTSSAILLTTAVITSVLGSKNVLSNIIDRYTGEYLTFTTTTEISTDVEVDGVIYIKYSGNYYKRDYTGPLDVRWFGAIADASSDNTAAVQSAINILGVKGGTILFAPGDYVFSGTITINKNITLLGGGLNNAQHTNSCVRLFHFPVSSGIDFFKTGVPQPGYGYIGGISIINFTILGSANSRYCFNMDKAAGMLIKQIYTDTFVDALVLEFALNSRIEQCNFAVNSNSCVRFTGIPYSTTVTFSDCYFHFSKWGVIVEHNTSIGIVFDKCIVESCDEGGYDIHTDNTVSINIPYAENVPRVPTANVPIYQVGVNGIEKNPGYPTGVLTIFGGNSAGCSFGLDPDSVLMKLDKVQNVTIVGAIFQRTTDLIETTANTKMVTFDGCTTFEITNLFDRIFDRSKVVFSNYSNNNAINLLLETPELKFIGNSGGYTSIKPVSTLNENTILVPDASGTAALTLDFGIGKTIGANTTGNAATSNSAAGWGSSGTGIITSDFSVALDSHPSTIFGYSEGSGKAGLYTALSLVGFLGIDLKAPLASPALTGTPTAPTPAIGDTSTKIATTAFINQALGNKENVSSKTNTVTSGRSVLLYTSERAVYDAVITKADDAAVVHKIGDENIGGSKTFTGGLTNFNLHTYHNGTSTWEDLVASGGVISDYTGIDIQRQSDQALKVLWNSLVYRKDTFTLRINFPTTLTSNTILTLPTTSGRLALASEIPSISDLVDKSTTQNGIAGDKEWTGENRFRQSIVVGPSSGSRATYSNSSISTDAGNLQFPDGSGIIGYLPIINTSLTTTQTSASLNTAFPLASVGQTVTAKNVGTGMKYEKINNTGGGQWIAWTVSPI